MTRGTRPGRGLLVLGLVVLTAGTTAAGPPSVAAVAGRPVAAASDGTHVLTVPSEAEFEAAVAAGDPNALSVFGATGLDVAGRVGSRSAAASVASSGCGAAAADPVPNGRPIVVSLPPARAFTVGRISARAWRNPPVSDPTWQLRFRGLGWMMPLAQRAAADGQNRSLTALVDQAVAFHQQNPDPGTSRYGWDEGTAMRRLSTLNCLYALTRSRRLVPAMTANAVVQFGSRYYGPPYRMVHNHGLMANMVVLRTARLLGNDRWRRAATARIVAEAPKAWSRAGTTWEQSTMYHVENMELWTQAAQALGAGSAGGRAIRRLVAKADQVKAWMTEPDGGIAILGDASAMRGTTRSRWTARSWRDDATGFGIGRWSWRDPATAYYTVRYGPPTAAHGHQDRGGVTWSDLGVRVLVTAGLFTYDPGNRFLAYQDGPASNNVAFPSRPVLDTRASVRLLRTKIQATSHQWVLTDRLFRVAHQRGIVVQGPQHRLTVADSFVGRGTYLQKFHLAPGWTLSALTGGGRTARFTGPEGRRLTMTTTGSIRRARGATSPVAGWHFPRFGQRVATEELTVVAGPRVTTTFTLS